MIYQLIALLILATFFIGIPEVLKSVWPSNINNAQLFQIVALQSMHILFYLISNGYYFICYSLNNPKIESFKVEKSKWPWEQSLSEWHILRRNTILNYVKNIIIGIVIATLGSLTKVKQRIDRDSFPTYFELYWQLLFCLLTEDLCFYITHRSLHHPSLYKFHKQHHTYTVTVSISAEYAHPIEYIFGNILPFIIGPALLGNKMHLLSTCVWMAFRIFKTHSGHSGYLFPWEPFMYIPMGSQGEFHSYHHSHNTGNYGSAFTMWDWIFNTNISYREAKNNDNYGVLKLKYQ